MKQKTILIFLAILVSAFLVFLVLWIFLSSSVDANVKASILGLFGMLAVALVTQNRAKEREIAARHFEDKQSSYKRFVDLIVDLALKRKTKKTIPEEDTLKIVIEFKKTLIVWGGAKIIEAWNNFETKMDDSSALTLEEKIEEMGVVLQAIRSDLGHDDGNLKFGSLCALLLNAEDKPIAFGLERKEKKEN